MTKLDKYMIYALVITITYLLFWGASEYQRIKNERLAYVAEQYEIYCHAYDVPMPPRTAEYCDSTTVFAIVADTVWSVSHDTLYDTSGKEKP